MLIYLIPELVSLAITVTVAAYAWRRRAIPGAASYAWVAGLQAWWTLGLIFELLSPQLDEKIFWDNAQFAGAAFVVPLLAFAAQFSGWNFRRPWRTYGLLAMPFVVLCILAFTDPLHHLIRAHTALIQYPPFNALVYDFTPTVVALTLYSYAVYAAAAALLLRRFVRAQALYRAQSAVIVAGTLIPVLGTALALTGVLEAADRDISPYTFAIGNLIVLGGLFFFRLFDLVPVAREAVIESMHEAAFVLDNQDRIVDVNPAGRELLGIIGRAALIGQPASQVLVDWPDLVKQLPALWQEQAQVEMIGGPGGKSLEVTLQTLRSPRGQILGRLIIARDLTARRQMEAELRRARDELEERVRQRTADLEQANQKLRGEVAERSRVEAVLDQSQQTLRALLDASVDPAFLIDVDGRLLAFNEALRLSYDPPEMIKAGINILDVLPTDVAEERRGKMRQVVADGQPARFEDFSRRWYDNNITPIKAADGQVRSLAVHARDVTDYKQAETALRRYAARMELLHQIDRAIQTANSPLEIASGALPLTRSLIGADRVGIALLDPETGDLLITALDAENAELMPAGTRLPVSIFAEQIPVLQQGQVYVYTAGTVATPFNRADVFTFGFSAPMQGRNRLIGALSAWTAKEAFSADQIEIACDVASQIAVAIQQVDLLAETTRALEREQGLVAIARQVSSSLAEPEALTEVLRLAAVLLGAESSALSLVDADGVMVVQHLYNLPGGLSQVQSPVGRGLAGQVVAGRRAVLWPDYAAEPLAVPAWREAGVRAAMAVPLLLGGSDCLGALGFFHLTPGRQFSSRDQAVAESVASQLAVAVQNARLFRAEQAARLRAGALVQAARSLSATLSLEDVLQKVLGEGARIAPFTTGAVLVYESSGPAALALAGYEGPLAALAGEVRRQLPDSALLKRASLSASPLLVPDIEAEPTWDYLPINAHVRCWLGVPLWYQDRALGVVALESDRPRAFNLEQAAALQALAAQAAIVVHNIRLFDEVRAGREQLQALSRQLVTVQEEERRHIARELHDEIGQSLTGLKLVLQVLPRLEAEAAAAQLQVAVQLVNELTEHAHDLSLDLRPAMLDDLGLAPALLWLFERYQARTGIQVRSEFVRLESRLSGEVEVTAYRIVQEALTNVARHGQVNEAYVRLLRDEVSLRIQVRDAGPGFDVAAALTGGRRAGLAGMYERAALLGGWLRVDSAPGAGTQVIGILPVAGKREETL